MIFDGVINHRGEVWLPANFPVEHDISDEEIIYISNYGRLVKIIDGTPKVFKAYNLNGYPHIKIKTNKTLKYKGYNKRKYKGYYLHKLVAQYFLEQNNGKYVIHLDYDKLNNHVKNLKWATKEGKEQHQWENPLFLKNKNKRTYSKLTENNVRLIKKKLNDPKRRTRLKMIAKQFGISTMQLRRIQTGENWADVPSL